MDLRTKLYKLHQGQGFELESAGTDPHFYDLNEDSAGIPARWYLEVRVQRSGIGPQQVSSFASRRALFRCIRVVAGSQHSQAAALHKEGGQLQGLRFYRVPNHTLSGISKIWGDSIGSHFLLHDIMRISHSA